MRYLAIDYGLKRAGFAVCDPEETIVSPLCQLDVDRSQLNRLVGKIKEIVDDYQVQAVVMGLPLNMDGSEGGQAKLTREFAAALGNVITVPIHYQDERLSTNAAKEKLAQSGLPYKKWKEKRDMLAACEILHDFLKI